ncbi:MAG: T9SS type A sorting domain-containing protein [Bacteroidales bacterium]|nr:T9SS type A sorting domain-containing protein [Bacteroidales bacterium]
MKKLNFIVLLFLFLSFFGHKTNAQTFVVDWQGTGDYESIGLAIDGLVNFAGADVTIEVKEGSYNEQVVISSLVVNSLTIKAIGEVTIDVTGIAGEMDNYAFKLQNVNNLTLQGLSFRNENTDFGGVLYIDGDGTGSSNQNIIIDSCSFYGLALYSGENPDMSLIRCSDQTAASDMVISRCYFTGGSIGVLFDTPGITSNYNINIEDNFFDNIGHAAIIAHRVGNFSIHKNNFFAGYSASNHYGIIINEANYGLVINRNSFDLQSDLINSAIAIDSSNDITTSAIIINNMISLSGAGQNTAISVFDYSAKILFNNINIVGGNSSSAAISIIKDNDAWFHDELYNNIYRVDFQGFALYYYNVISNDIVTNNNIYEVISGYFANYNSNSISDWASFQATLGYQNTQSLEASPDYTSYNDLHVNNFQAVSGAGLSVSGVNGLELFDFDNQLRKIPPDIGADEVGNFLPAVVSEDTIWSGLNFVNQSIIIAAGATVQILPNTKIIFNNPDSILCHGNIMASGTYNQPIAFYALGDSWAGITFDNSTNSNFDYTAFHNSLSGSNGGAIEITSGNITFNHCEFQANGAPNGGAIYNNNASVYFEGCSFLYNTSYENGGAIYTAAGNTSVDNCLFVNNNATINGGDIFISDMINLVDIVHSTFYFSEAMSLGDSVYSSNSDVYIKNSLVGGQSNSLIYKEPGSGYLAVWNTNVNMGIDNIINYDSINNIYNDNPQWVNPDDLDFHLLPGSFAIDLGDPEYVMNPYDFDGNNRIYGAFPDLGAFEFQGIEMFAFAGNDTTICSTSYQLQANNPAIFTGTWSIIQGTGNFEDINEFNTVVTDLYKGDNILVWSVSDGFETLSDTVIITNVKPVANAGDDIYLVSDNYPVLIQSCQIELGFFNPIEEWIEISTDGFGYLNISGNLFELSALQHGEQVLTYTIWRNDDETCFDVDEVIISSGFSIYPSSKQKGLQWDNPTAWNVGALPQEGDSVSIFGTDMHINDIDAYCTSLVVTTSGSLVIDGTGKSPTTVHANRVFIEQDAEKFPNIDTARLLLTNGTIYIDSASGGIDDGLVIGSLADVVIEPVAGGVADIIMGKNRRLRVQGSAVFKNSRGNGQVVVRNGGRIFIEQDAEKTILRGNDGIIHVGTGGRIFIEQDAEKGDASTIYVTHGGRIFIEQDAEKGNGGSVVVRGGRIFIEQDAEKDINSSSSGLFISNGGQVILDATASSDSSVLDIGNIQIYNGKLTVGSLDKNRGGQNTVHANRVFIEQDAEKDFASDTILVVGVNGVVNISSSPNSQGIFHQKTKTAIQVFEGGELNVLDNSIFIMDKGASFIDMNQNSSIWAQQSFPIISDSIFLFSTPFSAFSAANINQGVSMYWDENLGEFVDLEGGNIDAGLGYLLYNTGNSYTEQFWGTFNTGTVSKIVTSNNNGVNLLGNPYPSAVDFDLLSLDPQIQPAFYIYDFGRHNFIIHQTNGLSFTDLGSILTVNQAFFVFAANETNFDFINNARVHYYEPTVAKNPDNYLTFSVFDGVSTDDLGLVFDNTASVNHDLYEDVVEFSAIEYEENSFYALSADNVPLAINTQPMPDSTTIIPLKYMSGNEGDVTISLTQNYLLGYSELYLYDADTELFNDLILNPDYTFNYSNIGSSKEMYLTFLPYFTNGNDITNNNIVKIYSYRDKIFVNSQNSNIQNIEIYSTTGIKLYDQNFNTTNAVIQADVLPGIYIVKAICGNNIYTSKVVME